MSKVLIIGRLGRYQGIAIISALAMAAAQVQIAEPMIPRIEPLQRVRFAPPISYGPPARGRGGKVRRW